VFAERQSDGTKTGVLVNLALLTVKTLTGMTTNVYPRIEIIHHRQLTVPLCLGVRDPGIAELRSVVSRVAS
jgi:hypothetical protein